MATYHINPESGEPKRCVARPGNCRYGADANHYDSKDSARLAYEKSQSVSDALDLSRFGIERPLHPEATFEEVRDFCEKAIAEEDLKAEFLATYSMTARAIIKEHPDAATMELIRSEEDIGWARVYDAYGSYLAGYDIGNGEPNGRSDESNAEEMLTRLTNQALPYDDDDDESFYNRQEDWEEMLYEVPKEFADTGEKPDWKKDYEDFSLDLAKAADWSPQAYIMEKPAVAKKEYDRISNYREAHIQNGNVKVETMSTYSMMARSVVKEHPNASAVEVLSNDKGERYAMRVLDKEGSEIGSYDIRSNVPNPDSPDDSPVKLMSELYHNGATYPENSYQKPGASPISQVTSLFKDSKSKDWWSKLKGDRFDLKEAKTWTPDSRRLR